MSGARLSLALLVLATGCQSVRPCASGTLWLDLTFAGASGADHLLVDVSVGGRVLHDDTPLMSTTTGSLALDFPGGYPAGDTAAITVTAAHGGTALATASTSTPLAPGCTRSSLALAPIHDVTVVGSTPAELQNTSALSVAAPSGVTAGDFLVVTLYIDSSTVTAQLPVGWSPLAELSSGEGFHVWCLTRTADSALAPFSVGFNGTANAAGVMVAYRGVDAAQPIDVHSSPTTLTGTVDARQIRFTVPSITTTRAGDRLLAVFVIDNYGESWNTAPAGMTTLVSDAAIGLFDSASVVAGPTGDLSAAATFGTNDSTSGTGFVIALAPAP